MNIERRAYEAGISDEQWQLVGPEFERLTPPSRRGQRRKVNLRTVDNSIQYHARTGCQWDKPVSINRTLRYLKPSPNQSPFSCSQKSSSAICRQSENI